MYRRLNYSYSCYYFSIQKKVNRGALPQACGTFFRPERAGSRRLLFCRVSPTGRQLLAKDLLHTSADRYKGSIHRGDVLTVLDPCGPDWGPFSLTASQRRFRASFGESWRDIEIDPRIISTSIHQYHRRGRTASAQGAVNFLEKLCACSGWHPTSHSGSRPYCCRPKDTNNLIRQQKLDIMNMSSKREVSLDMNVRSSKKQKVVAPSVAYRVRIQQAAKRGTVQDAFNAFDEARRENIKLSADCFVTLLFLASGADDWEALVDEADVDAKDSIPFLHRCDEVLEAMQESSYPPIEMCYTALARRDAILGKASAALDNALSVVDKGLGIKLRCFSPALAAFAVRGDAKGAWKVYESIIKLGLEPTEVEFSKVIQALGKADIDDEISWGQVTALLAHLSRETTELKCDTIDNIRLLFTSRRAMKGLNMLNNEGVGSWQVGNCTVSENGFCDYCKDFLQAIDLSADEYAQFGTGIASLASKQERHPNDFKSFISWLEENGPFGVIIDAANVAFYGQNFESGGFSFYQIESIWDRALKMFPHLKPLVILHVNRVRGQNAQSTHAKSFLRKISEANCFYTAPHGSNDDWYWMYAAIMAGQEGLLISNDEMRDHLFSLLAPKYFNKWKQRHQVRYAFSGNPASLTLEQPPPFTRCAQSLANGSWIFPCENGDWLCAKPYQEPKTRKDICQIRS